MHGTQTTIKDAVEGIVPRTEGVQVGWDVRVGRDSTDAEAVWVYVVVPDERIEELYERADFRKQATEGRAAAETLLSNSCADRIRAPLLVGRGGRMETLSASRNQAPNALPSHGGGPRAGAMRGGMDGSPMGLRIGGTGAFSVMKATMGISGPHAVRAGWREPRVEACPQHRPEIAGGRAMRRLPAAEYWLSVRTRSEHTFKGPMLSHHAWPDKGCWQQQR